MAVIVLLYFCLFPNMNDRTHPFTILHCKIKHIQRFYKMILYFKIQ